MQLKIMVLLSLLFNPIDLTPMGPITKCQYNRYKFKLLQVMWYLTSCFGLMADSALVDAALRKFRPYKKLMFRPYK